MSSTVLWTTSTSGKLARLRRPTAANAGPGSTQVMRNPRRASGIVALPEAVPISNNLSSASSPVAVLIASYSCSGYSGRARW